MQFSGMIRSANDSATLTGTEFEVFNYIKKQKKLNRGYYERKIYYSILSWRILLLKLNYFYRYRYYGVRLI